MSQTMSTEAYKRLASLHATLLKFTFEQMIQCKAKGVPLLQPLEAICIERINGKNTTLDERACWTATLRMVRSWRMQEQNGTALVENPAH